LLALLGVDVVTPTDTKQRARVLVLEVEGERVQLLVHGALELAEATAANLLQLPAAVRAMTPLLSHLAVLDGKPALFVISPERLLQAARGARTALPVHDSARGSSC
jgi:chemotaxis signal transduction protein